MTSPSQIKESEPSQSVIQLFSEMYSPMGIMTEVLKPKAREFCRFRGLSLTSMVQKSMVFYKSLSAADQSHARLRHVFTVERTKCVLSGIPFRWSDQQGYSIHTGSEQRCLFVFFLLRSFSFSSGVCMLGIRSKPSNTNRKASLFWPFIRASSTRRRS